MDKAIACGFPTVVRQCLGLPDQSLAQLSACRIRASGSRLDRHRTGDTVRFADVERHAQVTGAEVRGADHVHHCQSRRRRPAGVHAKKGIGVDVDRPAVKRSAARATEAVRVATTTRTARRASCDAGCMPTARQHAANEVQAPIDVPADEELLGRAPLELHSLGMTGAGGRLEVGVGGLGRPAGVGERVRRSLPSMPRRQAMPGSASGPAGRRTRPDRRRAPRPPSRRQDSA